MSPLDVRLDATVEERAVEFVLTVANRGTDAVDLEFPTARVADVVVCREGEEVWRWSDGHLFTQAVETRRLRPGDALERSYRWVEPPPGDYEARATLEAADRPSARLAFAVG